MEGYVNVPAAAEYLSLHPVTVRLMIKDGRLPAVRLKRQFRIAKADLERVWAAQAA